MPEEQEVKMDVTPAPAGGEAPAPKEEVTPAGVNGGESAQPAGDPKKADEIVNNLQSALKEERSFRQQDRTKIDNLQKQLEEALDFQKKMSSVFNPEPEPAAAPEYMTKEEAERLWQEKQEEMKRQTFEESQQNRIKDEIRELQKDYDGKDGRLKYDDTEVLQWQKDNNKLFLSPKEAFSIMKQKEIVDFQVKQALSGKKKVEDVERPSATPGFHDPKDIKPSTDQEVKQAIAEAIKTAGAEM